MCYSEVLVIILIGNGHVSKCLNTGQGCFQWNMLPTIFLPSMGK